MHAAAPIVPVVVICLVALLIAVYAYFPRIRGLHYTSRLTCPKCGYRFEYGWLPGGSLNSFRWGKYRIMRCPSCGQPSWFDVWSNRIE